MNCRHCHSILKTKFLDLGHAPPSNSYLKTEDLQKPEIYYPLRVYVCETCWLAQTDDYASRHELFNEEYAYFSSTSTTWQKHTSCYVDMICNRLSLDNASHVIELASNDGCLLKHFLSKNIPCLGVEPTHSTAMAAKDMGLEIIEEFFGVGLADNLLMQGKQSDLIIGNNVLAHVPDINDFVLGIKKILKTTGTVTLEFPHLMKLIQYNQFDTVYHEHFSYLSLLSVEQIFSSCGLRIYDIEELETHGGSLRVYGCHAESNIKTTDKVYEVVEKEKTLGLNHRDVYLSFQSKTDKVKNQFLTFLLEVKEKGQKVVAYGAAAKGNTLINYAGVKPDLLPVIFDAAPSKQSMYLPGSHIPIVSPDKITIYKPDWVIVLPWNFFDEISAQLALIKDWRGQFVRFVPEMAVL